MLHQFAVSCLLLLAGQDAYHAVSAPSDPAAALAVDPVLLQTQIRPLSKDEALAELNAWTALLREKAREIGAAEAAALASTGPDKAQLSERAALLRTERDKLIRRAEIVLELAEKKGAEIKEHRSYMESIVDLPPLAGVQAAWTTLRTWLLNPDGGLALLLKMGKFAATLIGFIVAANILGSLVQRAMTKMGRTSALLRNFIVNSVKKVTVFTGIVLALSMLGINIGPFVAAIGAAGFIIGFALQGTLSNFASGVMIMIYRPYDIGDFVTAAGVSGTVDSMTLVSTSIKTPDNQTIVVPNNSIWGGVITNVTANYSRRVDMVFGISYRDDIGKAKAVLEKILAGHQLVLKDPKPVVEVDELAESSVNFVVRPWAKTSDYATVRWDVTRQVKERFDQEGISIPFPQRVLHVHQTQPA